LVGARGSSDASSVGVFKLHPANRIINIRQMIDRFKAIS